MNTEFALEGPMTGGVPWEKASGPKSKWKPTPDVESVVGLVVEIVVPVPAEVVAMEDEEEKESEVVATEDEKEKEKEMVELTQEEKEMKKRTEEWEAERVELLNEWYVGRCVQSVLENETNTKDAATSIPTKMLLTLDAKYSSLRIKVNTAPKTEKREEDEEGVVDAAVDNEDEAPINEENPTDNISGVDVGDSLTPLLSKNDCRQIQQDILEDAIVRGEEMTSSSSTITIASLTVMNELWKRWNGNESSFNASVLPVFRTLRNGDAKYVTLWSEARSLGLRRLTDSTELERIVSKSKKRTLFRKM